MVSGWRQLVDEELPYLLNARVEGVAGEELIHVARVQGLGCLLLGDIEELGEGIGAGGDMDAAGARRGVHQEPPVMRWRGDHDAERVRPHEEASIVRHPDEAVEGFEHVLGRGAPADRIDVTLGSRSRRRVGVLFDHLANQELGAAGELEHLEADDVYREIEAAQELLHALESVGETEADEGDRDLARPPVGFGVEKLSQPRRKHLGITELPQAGFELRAEVVGGEPCERCRVVERLMQCSVVEGPGLEFDDHPTVPRVDGKEVEYPVVDAHLPPDYRQPAADELDVGRYPVFEVLLQIELRSPDRAQQGSLSAVRGSGFVDAPDREVRQGWFSFLPVVDPLRTARILLICNRPRESFKSLSNRCGPRAVFARLSVLMDSS